MKKTTLAVVLIAIALGAFVYFYDSKHSPAPLSDEASWKPAFSVKADAVTGITIESKKSKVIFAKQGNNWWIKQPVSTRADQTAVSGIIADLSSAKIRRSFPPTDALSKYGLDQPAVTIEFHQNSGASHTLRLGDRDFSGNAVYAFVDSGKSVDLLPASLLDETDQPLTQLRDRAVLDLGNAEITGITLKGPGGTVMAAKKGSVWEITKPKQVLADASAVDGLVSTLSNDKFTDVTSETAGDAAKYGLNHPAITIDAAAKGGEQFHFLVGKKNGDEYYARDTARPMVFEISSSLYDSLDKKFFDLRDKSILHFDSSNIASVQIQNANGTMECSQGKHNDWSMTEPAADKGKQVQDWKIFDPLQNTRATNIYDSPSPAILAHLKKPAIQIILVDKSKKATTIQISAASGKSVYVRTSDGPEVYEVGTQILTDFGFKPSDLFI